MPMVCQCWQVRAGVKLSDSDCSGGRDIGEALFVLGVNNQHNSEVMESG